MLNGSEKKKRRTAPCAPPNFSTLSRLSALFFIEVENSKTNRYKNHLIQPFGNGTFHLPHLIIYLISASSSDNARTFENGWKSERTFVNYLIIKNSWIFFCLLTILIHIGPHCAVPILCVLLVPMTYEFARSNSAPKSKQLRCFLFCINLLKYVNETIWLAAFCHSVKRQNKQPGFFCCCHDMTNK